MAVVLVTRSPKEGMLSAEAEDALLARITFRGNAPIIRGRGLAVERVLGLLAAGCSAETILTQYEGTDLDDIRACLVYARRAISARA